MATRAARTAALAALAGAALVLTVAGLSFDLTHLDAARIADRVRASGALGPLALIMLLVAQAVVAPLPSPPLLMAAGCLRTVGRLRHRLARAAPGGERVLRP